MSKHTPGPWSYVPNVDYKNSASGTHGFLILQKFGDRKNIATIVPCIGMTAEEVEANAKIISEAIQNAPQPGERRLNADDAKTVATSLKGYIDTIRLQVLDARNLTEEQKLPGMMVVNELERIIMTLI